MTSEDLHVKEPHFSLQILLDKRTSISLIRVNVYFKEIAPALVSWKNTAEIVRKLEIEYFPL